MQHSVELAPDGGDIMPRAFPEPRVSLVEAADLPPPLRLRYAAWLRVAGLHEDAAALLSLIERQAGESASVLDELAALALAARDAVGVRTIWTRRLDSYPAPSARASFARSLLELSEFDEAFAIADELLAEHGDLATVRALAAEVAFLQGDLATAHEHWAAQLSEDPTRIAPQLALARIALLSGDLEDAHAKLARVATDTATLTAAQIATSAALAELLGQPARAQALRLRYARLESERAAALAAEIDEALGRTRPSGPNGMTRDRTAEALDIENARKHPSPSTTTESESPEIVLEPADVVRVAEEPLADTRVLETLNDVFGYESLLPGQAAVINRAVAGRDTLAILPTGAGKSLTFQLSALLLPGTTLVLSPLIALMKDQVESLPPALRERTVLVNSTLSPADQERAVEAIAAGAFKLVYAAPERLRQHGFLRALRQTGVSLVVVDEAHCISLWGHDFRPDYLSIPAALPELGNPPLLAMTATASPETAASMAAGFRRELDMVRTSSFRPNLYYAAERLATKEDKARRVVALCRELKGQGIVYVSSRRDAENLAGVLGDNGVRAVPYHAGLEPRYRAANQDRFMRGEARVVVATVAFGMGIDKPDVRFIIHVSPSTSLEAYAQESGRAGRDRLDARCVLLYTASDRATQTRLARRDAMDLPTLRQVYAGIKRHAAGTWAIFDPSRIVLGAQPGIDVDEASDPRIGIGLLVEGGLLERHPNAPATWTLTPAGDLDTAPSPLDDNDAAIWERLTGWANLDGRRNRQLTLQTSQVCQALDISPETLARVLDGQPEWEAREGIRLPCLQLLPVETDAGARLQRVLDAAAQRASDRVDRTMRYAEGRRCRHSELAAHLGERLPPCGDACDVCTGQNANDAEDRSRRERRPRKRTETTAADALAVIQALASLPFPLGKTGLTRLLEGSIQSRIQGDRSPFFGALSDMQKSKIEGLIDRLVEDGFLLRDMNHEFKLIRLTERATPAGLDDLIAYDENGDLELSPEDDAKLIRLQDWRRDRAERDGVAAFVVAHNSALTEIARRHPDTLEDLARIKGYGQSRATKYGDEILSVLREGTEVGELAAEPDQDKIAPC